jgi:hypothetical protein
VSRAEKLREAIYTQWGGLMNELQIEAVLRTVVDELGITREMVRQIAPTPLICDDDTCDGCRPARALATLLDAAGAR